MVDGLLVLGSSADEPLFARSVSVLGNCLRIAVSLWTPFPAIRSNYSGPSNGVMPCNSPYPTLRLSSCSWATDCVKRSITMARNTIASPAIAPLPGWFFCSARSTLSPSPPAATMLAIVTIANAIIVVWLMPAMIVGSAIGICTLVSSWNGVVPNACAASTASVETCRIPRLVRRMTGGTA